MASQLPEVIEVGVVSYGEGVLRWAEGRLCGAGGRAGVGTATHDAKSGSTSSSLSLSLNASSCMGTECFPHIHLLLFLFYGIFQPLKVLIRIQISEDQDVPGKEKR